jgi:hypothetical protein
VTLAAILGTDNPADIAAFLRDNYIHNTGEMARRQHAALLDEFYKNCGDKEMERVIDLLWTDPANNKRRKDVLKAGLDKYDNVIKRVATEIATVYNKPAQRKVAEPANAVYQQFLDVLPQDAVMAVLDAKLAIHDDALLWYRVRVTPTGEREPLLEVISPACFWAVCHPKDRTQLVAIIFDQSALAKSPDSPAYYVWTDDETFELNLNCDIIAGTVQPWPLGKMPGVLCSMVPPGAKETLLTPAPSADLLSAQKQVRLQDLNSTKESVSVSRQVMISGDTSATAMGQSNDTDGEVFLGEGVSASAIDRGVDTEQYHGNAERAADTAAANHGIPPTVRSQKDASSGAEIEMRRIPIREVREKRIPFFRRFEAAIVKVMAMVNGARVTTDADGEPVGLTEGDLSQFAFTADGFSIDFGEIQQPMTEAEKDAVFSFRRQLGLTNTLDEIRLRNPDIKTDADAEAVLDRNIKIETQRVAKMKDLMAMNGSMGASTEAVAGNAPNNFQANRGQPLEPQQDPAAQDALKAARDKTA